MMRITTGDVARVLKSKFPQVTDDMVRMDVEAGILQALPRFRNKGWWYVDLKGIPAYLKGKGIPQAEITAALKHLGV